MKKKKKTVLRLFKKISLFVGLIALIAGLVVFLKSALIVKKIDCQYNQVSCPSEIWLELMSLTIGKNIVFLPAGDLVSQIKESYPILKEIKIKKILPSQVFFKLIKREPQSAIKAEKEFLVVDEEGFLLEKTDNTELPVIIFKPSINLNVGEQIAEKEILWLIKLLKDLKLHLFKPQTAKIISPRQIEVSLTNKTLVIFSSLKEVDFQLDSLQLIFSRAKIEGKSLKQVDLRFDKPVVIYE